MKHLSENIFIGHQLDLFPNLVDSSPAAEVLGIAHSPENDTYSHLPATNVAASCEGVRQLLQFDGIAMVTEKSCRPR
jgi:hypothetical protein